MSEISVKKLSFPVVVEVDAAGRPYCFCGCGGLLVEVEPGSFMCPDWAFMHVLQQEWLRAYQSALSTEEERWATEHIYGNRSGEPKGILASLATFGQASEPALSLCPVWERYAVQKDSFFAPVDWDAALRTLGRASA